MVFWGAEIELYPVRCFLIYYIRFSFKHKSIKQRNCKMNCAIPNFSLINQKNNITAMLPYNISQLRCSSNLSSKKKTPLLQDRKET